MTPDFVLAIAVLMFVCGIMCFFGLLGGGWIVALILVVCSLIPGTLAFLMWADMSDV